MFRPIRSQCQFVRIHQHPWNWNAKKQSIVLYIITGIFFSPIWNQEQFVSIGMVVRLDKDLWYVQAWFLGFIEALIKVNPLAPLQCMNMTYLINSHDVLANFKANSDGTDLACGSTSLQPQMKILSANCIQCWCSSRHAKCQDIVYATAKAL